jgi:hypothetical protein
MTAKHFEIGCGRSKKGIVTSLGSRRHYSAIGDQEEAVIREAACGFVSRLIASIPRPGDPKS